MVIRGYNMKVIFLDIDGVLVTKNHLMQLNDAGKRMTDAQGHHLFDPACVARLKRIIDTTDAKIVLSSCWKMFGPDKFSAIWADRSCPGDIIDFTQTTISGDRGHEIDIWLRANVGLVESFVILDDDVSDLFDGQMDRVVKTTWDDGLTDDDVNKAINILNFVEL